MCYNIKAFLHKQMQIHMRAISAGCAVSDGSAW